MQYQNSQCCYNSDPNCFSGCGQTLPIVPGSNPALNYWNGQNFVVADGSAQNPIILPNIQNKSGDPSYYIGVNNNGVLSYYNNIINNIVTSVNGKTGAVVLTASDVGAATPQQAIAFAIAL
jgi:hypothetical protein